MKLSGGAPSASTLGSDKPVASLSRSGRGSSSSSPSSSSPRDAGSGSGSGSGSHGSGSCFAGRRRLRARLGDPAALDLPAAAPPPAEPPPRGPAREPGRRFAAADLSARRRAFVLRPENDTSDPAEMCCWAGGRAAGAVVGRWSPVSSRRRRWLRVSCGGGSYDSGSSASCARTAGVPGCEGEPRGGGGRAGRWQGRRAAMAQLRASSTSSSGSSAVLRS